MLLPLKYKSSTDLLRYLRRGMGLVRTYCCFSRGIGEFFAGNGAYLLVLVQVLMLAVLLMAMKSLPLVMVLVKFGFRKNKGGSDAWRMLLPLNPQMLLREAPRK
jgi:hypothetical protein